MDNFPLNFKNFTLTKESMELFPLSRIEQVVELFQNEIAQEDPNITILSIILGAIEYNLAHNLTKVPKKEGGKENLSTEKDKGKDDSSVDVTGETTADDSSHNFPPVQLETVQALYKTFLVHVCNDLKDVYKLHEKKGMASPTYEELVKYISNIIWNSLAKTYKGDKPHLQTLYTYITINKLDSFGVALAVSAGAQATGIPFVHLTLSEDHSWVTFGKDGELNAEVTWHGKGVEDKRGHPAGLGEDEGTWLYLNGSPIICDRHMEIAAMVASISPFISQGVESNDLNILQQKLFWVLYDAGHLKKYPMAIGNLAHLEESSRTPSRPSPLELYEEGIESAKIYYQNRHVYPYLNYAGYLYKTKDFKSTLKNWAEATNVVREYRYKKSDENIYNQFLQITTERLVAMMKQSSSGISANSILRDPSCFVFLLRFCDGICQWEENTDARKSMTVVHNGWAKAWSQAIGKFPHSVRSSVKIISGKGSSEATGSNGTNNLTTDPIDYNGNKKDIGNAAVETFDFKNEVAEQDLDTPAIVEFTSQKMLDIKDLIAREKLNTGAISLILTAQGMKLPQSTSSSPHVTDGDGLATSTLPKKTFRSRKSTRISLDEKKPSGETNGNGEESSPLVVEPPKKRRRE